jgi:hypothetical protein
MFSLFRLNTTHVLALWIATQWQLFYLWLDYPEISVERQMIKEKFTLSWPWKPIGGVEEQLYSFLTTALDLGGWSTPRLGRFTPGMETRNPTVQEAGWAPGPVWTDTENLALTEIRFPDHQARSESLYRLRYTGLQINVLISEKLRYPATRFPRRCRIKQFLHYHCLSLNTFFRVGLDHTGSTYSINPSRNRLNIADFSICSYISPFVCKYQ